jgi:hypothetical protein
MPVHLSTVLLTLLAIALPAGAQTNWPWFRGANADGIARGAATATVWNVEKSQNVLWRRAIPGLGHSSPIIWGDLRNDNYSFPLATIIICQ